MLIMNIYDYLQAVTDDVVYYLKENVLDDPRSFEEIASLDVDQLNDDLWIEDSVTGNSSGSYTMSTLKAEQNLVGNYNLLCETLTEFGDGDRKVIDLDPEAADVTIRCYLLSQAIDDAIEYLEDEALGE